MHATKGRSLFPVSHCVLAVDFVWVTVSSANVQNAEHLVAKLYCGDDPQKVIFAKTFPLCPDTIKSPERLYNEYVRCPENISIGRWRQFETRWAH